MRSFNTAGPIIPEEHYHLPPLDRMDLDGLLHLIHGKKYFVLHAPRQTGKTSALLALQNLLNSGSEGDFRCVYANVEVGQVARDDVGHGMHAILGALALGAEAALGDEFIAKSGFGILDSFGPASGLMHVVSRWARADPRPLVLLIDEIDALVGDTLVSVLRQLRSGYILRPRSFPASIVLCGVRDLRDYRIESGTGKPPVTGGSAFNISARSLRLGDFSRAEVEALLGQHTEETGQAFQAEAVERVWTQTCGQPWLVNALCEQACRENARERDCPVTEDAILEAQERLILERVVHLDQLADKLREDRVRRVIEPMLSGRDWRESPSRDLDRLRDLEYVRDLGLIAVDDPLRIANPIYAEVVPRELTAATQSDLEPHTVSYVDAEGGLDLARLLEDFQAFFRQHSEHWLKRFDYQEAGPQLLLQAFLQRVVNGGGRIEREYGLGTQRTDLLIVWPLAGTAQRFVIECKILRGNVESVISKGVAQTVRYMDKCAADEGHLVIFDRGRQIWAEKVFRRLETTGNTSVTVWGM